MIYFRGPNHKIFRLLNIGKRYGKMMLIANHVYVREVGKNLVAKEPK